MIFLMWTRYNIIIRLTQQKLRYIWKFEFSFAYAYLVDQVYICIFQHGNTNKLD